MTCQEMTQPYFFGEGIYLSGARGDAGSWMLRKTMSNRSGSWELQQHYECGYFGRIGRLEQEKQDHLEVFLKQTPRKCLRVSAGII